MKKQTWTVVGLCLCGCEEPFVRWLVAKSAMGAEEACLAEHGRPSRVLAIFKGQYVSQRY